MIKSEIKDFLLTLFNNVWIWIALLIILLVIYALSTGKRDAIPKLFDIREIISGYYKVFPIQIDFLYLLAVVSLLARITMLLNLNDDNTFSQSGRALSFSGTKGGIKQRFVVNRCIVALNIIQQQ